MSQLTGRQKLLVYAALNYALTHVDEINDEFDPESTGLLTVNRQQTTPFTHGDLAEVIPHFVPPPPVCPYCRARVEETDEKRYVNGLKPVKGKGCEFCNPSPVRPA